MSAMPTYDVFISHARPDAKTAHELAAQLSSRGLEVFLDSQIFQWGDNWTETIDQAVQNASAVAVLISPDAAGSRGVKAELATAQASARGGNSLLIPVLLGDLSPRELPPALQKFQYLRIDGQLGIAHAADEIARSIHNLVPRASNRIEGGIPDAPPNYFDTGQAQSLIDTLTSTLGTETGLLEVVGVGGSGKTTLVAEACRRIRDQYDIVWFIRAVAPEESLTSSLAALALELGIDGRKSDPEELAADALTAIETSGRSWLIVFDEADSIGPALRRWLPRPSRTGTAVLVVREPLRWLNRATTRFYVTQLNKAWSIDFIRQLLTESVHADLQEDDLARISEVGGGSPLALRLIGAFLNNQSDSLDVRVQQLLNPAATQQTETESLVSHALDRATELTATSGSILRTLSWLGDAPFPVDALILAAADEYLSSSPAEVEQTIRALEGASIIEVNEDALAVHDLVRARLVRFHDPRSSAFLREAIANYLDSQAATPPKHLRWLAVHALNLLSGISSVLDGSEQAEFLVLAQRLARYLAQTQSFELAHQLLQQTLYDSNRILGPDHPSTLTTRANLAGILQDLGRYEEAAELLQQTLNDCLRALGPDDALTSTVQANLQFITRQLRSGGAHG